MHAGNLYSSDRLWDTWLRIRYSEDGATTDQLGRCTGSRCPGTDVSAIRKSLEKQQSPWDIECKYERTTKNGSKVYRYRAVMRT